MGRSFLVNLILEVIRENGLPITVMLGIWLRAEISNHRTCSWLTEPVASEVLDANTRENEREIRRAIGLAREYPSIVAAVNVGNEILVDWNDHGVTLDHVLECVRIVKSEIHQPVTVADNVHWWLEHGDELARLVDFLAIHSYPIWTGSDIDEGIDLTIREVETAMAAYPNRQIALAEAGWATVATEFGDRAGIDKQARYYREIMEWARSREVTVFFFEAFDEPWKGDPGRPDGAEKHWGLFDVQRRRKRHA